MELFEQILTTKLGPLFNRTMYKAVPTIVEGSCYQALLEIKRILEDDRLSDPECFLKIEEIVCVLEDLGSDAGTRHDFG